MSVWDSVSTQPLETQKEHSSHEGHKPRHEAIASPLEDPEESGEERRREDEADGPALEHVGNEKPRRRFVEAVGLLEHERLIDGEWDGR